MPKRFARPALRFVGATGVPSEIPVCGFQIREAYYSPLLTFFSSWLRSSCQGAISVCWGYSTYLYTPASSRAFLLFRTVTVLSRKSHLVAGFVTISEMSDGRNFPSIITYVPATFTRLLSSFPTITISLTRLPRRPSWDFLSLFLHPYGFDLPPTVTLNICM